MQRNVLAAYCSYNASCSACYADRCHTWLIASPLENQSAFVPERNGRGRRKTGVALVRSQTKHAAQQPAWAGTHLELRLTRAGSPELAPPWKPAECRLPALQHRGWAASVSWHGAERSFGAAHMRHAVGSNRNARKGLSQTIGDRLHASICAAETCWADQQHPATTCPSSAWNGCPAARPAVSTP